MARLKPRRYVSSVGWAWFFVGLLIASFFGGAVRALLSERQIKAWVERNLEKENPPYEVQFERARIVLADGWWPKFGIEVQGFRLIPKDQCQIRLNLSIRRFFLPGSISVLWGQRLRFHTLRAEGVLLERLEPCGSSGSQAPQIGHTEQGASVVAVEDRSVPRWLRSLNSYMTSRWPIELARTSEWLDGVEILDWQIIGLPEPLREIHLDYWSASLESQTKKLSVRAKVKQLGPFVAIPGTPLFELEAANSESEIDFTIVAKAREGEWKTAGKIDAKQMHTSGSSEFIFMPADQVVAWLKPWRVVTDQLDLKRSWVSGRLEWQDQNLSVKEMKLSGDSGEVSLSPFSIQVGTQPVQFDAFRVEFKNMSLRYILEATGRKGYTGIIHDFGQFDGQLAVTDAENQRISGTWRGPALQFSRHSQRHIEVLESLRFQLAHESQRVTGLVDEIKIKDGNVLGQVSFNLDRNLLNGLFQVRLDQLQFSPAVQKLMLSGEMAPIAIYGQGQLRDGQVAVWSGEIGSEFIRSQKWAVERLKIKSEFASDQMVLMLRSGPARMLKELPLAEQLRPLNLQETGNEESLEFKLLSVRLDVGRNLGRWRNGLANVNGSKLVVSSSGEWTGGNISGVLNVDRPGKKPSTWKLSGPWSNFLITSD